MHCNLKYVLIPRGNTSDIISLIRILYFEETYR